MFNNHQELIQDTVMGLQVELFSLFPSVVKVEVSKEGNWYDFQLTTNKEFLSDQEHNEIFTLILDTNFDLRKKIGEKIYFRHSFIGVRKYFIKDMEFDTLSAAYKQLGDKIFPHKLIEVREL